MEPTLPESRDRLRMALDGLAAAFDAIAEQEPVSDDRTGKELVAWLAEHTEVSQAELASLLGVSPRQFQRWLSPAEKAGPEGDDLRRVRVVARIVNQLRFSLTPAGVVWWFSHRSPQLGRKRPIDLLDRPDRLPDLIALANDTRATAFA
jgi:DNA-binding transcriptional regulator YiaG